MICFADCWFADWFAAKRRETLHLSLVCSARKAAISFYKLTSRWADTEWAVVKDSVLWPPISLPTHIEKAGRWFGSSPKHSASSSSSPSFIPLMSLQPHLRLVTVLISDLVLLWTEQSAWYMVWGPGIAVSCTVFCSYFSLSCWQGPRLLQLTPLTLSLAFPIFFHESSIYHRQPFYWPLILTDWLIDWAPMLHHFGS